MNERILVVDDDLDILSALKILLVPEGYQVTLCQTPESALTAVKTTEFDLVLMDLNYTLDTTSGDEGVQLITAIKKLDEVLPIVVMTGWATIEIAVSTMQNGANDFIQKPWEVDRLLLIISHQIKLALSEKHFQKLSQQNQLLQAHLDSEYQGDIICQSPAMAKTMALIEQVAQSDASILLTGENGTGKSMFARYIHQRSQRSHKAQISVNMGAVTESLFESEMFGHVKGAFTDAKSTRIGRFELADGGTLFLDEIANTPYSQQGKLLRVLEEHQFEKVGASKTQSVDIRLVCATNADLTDAVSAGDFRKDLLYRINTFTIEIPPLRERKQDIVLLANSFLQQTTGKQNQVSLSLSEPAKLALESYDWPGNIRELSHVIERAKILCTGNEISADDLGLSVRRTITEKEHVSPTDNQIPQLNELASMEELELAIIEQRLSHFDGNVLKAAKSLNMSRSAFYRRLDKI